MPATTLIVPVIVIQCFLFPSTVLDPSCVLFHSVLITTVQQFYYCLQTGRPAFRCLWATLAEVLS